MIYPHEVTMKRTELLLSAAVCVLCVMFVCLFLYGLLGVPGAPDSAVVAFIWICSASVFVLVLLGVRSVRKR
jgi:hypothetical protein